MAASSLADRIHAAFGAWMMKNLDLLLCVARNLCPILVVTFRGRKFALITRYADVQEVLSRPNTFGVIYEPKLRLIMDGDNFFLGMNDDDQFTRDKTTMRMTAPRPEAASRVKRRVEEIASDIMSRAKGRVDIVMELTQEVTTRFFNEYRFSLNR